MGRTGRVDGCGHGQRKPLDSDGFRGQGRAIGHRGDHRAVRRREGQRGQKNAGRGASSRELLSRMAGVYCPRQHWATCWDGARATVGAGETPEGHLVQPQTPFPQPRRLDSAELFLGVSTPQSVVYVSPKSLTQMLVTCVAENPTKKGPNMIARLLAPVLLLMTTSHCVAQQAAAPPEAKPYIGTWQGEEDRQLGLPAPTLKVRKDGTGAYFLGKTDKPLYEFKWKLGEEEDLQATVTDGERFFAGILRQNGKLVWKAVKLPPGKKSNGIEFEKVPSDF